MNWITQLFSRRRLYTDLSAEIEEHLSEKIEELVAGGMSRAEATRTARREFGNVTLLEERSREVWQWPRLESFFGDIRFALHMLRKSPGFTVVAVITLALGIGANTAIFSVVDAVLLRPLPFPHFDRLVSVQYFDTVHDVPHRDVSYPDFFDWRKQNQVFSSMTAFHDNDYTLTGTDQPAHLSGEVVTADFFKTLGVAPLLGRGLVPEDEKPGHQVVVLSNRLWRMSFAADPKIIGRTIELNNHTYTVVGVMPPGFDFPVTSPPIELWTSCSDDAGGSNPPTAVRGSRFPDVIARLRAGVNLAQAQADMARINSNLAKQYADTNLPLAGAYLQPELQHLVGDVAPALLVLLGAVGCVLLMACVNVAGLLLGRGMLRQREMAVRTALGASRSRIIRQLLTESVLLGVFGGTAGLALGFWGIAGLVHLFPEGAPRVSEAHMNSSVFLFVLVTSVVTGILFGLAPAMRISKTNLVESIKEGGPMHSAGRARGRLRSVLVATETALALVLLTGAGLMIQSFARLQSVNPGFDPHRVLTFNFDLSSTGFSIPQRSAFYDQFLHRLDALPGVVSSAGSFPLPMSGNRVRPQFSIQGHPVARGNEPHANVWLITSDFFSVMRIPLVEGREFNPTDGPNNENVAVINQAFARRYLPNENPIGKYIIPNILGRKSETRPPARLIVGVVGDVRTDVSKAAEPQFYLPYSQVPTGASLVVVARTATDPGSVTSAARAALKSLNPNVPIYDVESMDDYVGAWVTPQRIVALLVSAFAGLALVLTAFGLYGVISYSVTQRTHEIGIRMALGAEPSQVMHLILAHGLRLAAIGVAIGIGAALALTRLMSSLLFGISATDPLTFAGVSIVLLGVAMAACYIPARRAMRVDPMVALRYE